MNALISSPSSVAPDQYLTTNRRTLTYRDVGSGKPVVLCPCLRGGIDAWDPAFLDNLVYNGLRVITFDYAHVDRFRDAIRGDLRSAALDPAELIEGLDLVDVVIAGWSVGGLIAQAVLASGIDRLSHGVLLATPPPGAIDEVAMGALIAWACAPPRPLEEEIVALVDENSSAGLAAAQRSTNRIAGSGRGAGRQLCWRTLAMDEAPPRSHDDAMPCSPETLLPLASSSIPLLHVGGGRDRLAPVDGWHELSGRLPNLQVITLACAGHGPHFEFPEAVADYITTFTRTTP